MRTTACALLALVGLAAPAAASEADLAAARALFEANLNAIRDRDANAYLATYLDAPSLARTGPEGVTRGFDSLASGLGSAWPTRFEGTDLQLVAVRPGVVYGTYRYRALDADVEQSGVSERLFIETPAGWRIAVTSAFPAPPGTPPPPRALIGATLIDGTGAAPVPDAVVVLRGGSIDCAGARAECPVPEGVEVRDVTGHWIVPGLVDAHVHFSQTGWADGRPDALDVRPRHPYPEVVARRRAEPESFFRSWLCSGVTAVFDVGGYPWTWGLRARVESDTRAPHVAAAGPLLSTLDHWLNLPAERQFIHLTDAASAQAGVDYLAAQRSDAVKVWFIDRGDHPSEELAAAVRAAGAQAAEAGLPLIVHATGLEQARVAVEAGARLLVHSVEDQLVDERFLVAARAQGTIYCPTLTVASGYLRMAAAALDGRGPVVDDPNGCVDPGTLALLAETPEWKALVDPDRQQQRAARARERDVVMAENLRRVHAAGIPVAMGTDAGNPLTLHGPSVYAEMEAMQAAGLTPLEVLAAATRNAARAMGRAERFGTLEPGRAADLLVLAADPTLDVANLRRLRWVVRGGEVRAVEELRAPTGGPAAAER